MKINSGLAYLIGMIFGNGEVQRGSNSTIITIDIPYKNLRTDDDKDVSVYVKASLFDIMAFISPIVGSGLIRYTNKKNSTSLTIEANNNLDFIEVINNYISSGTKQHNLKMSHKVFLLPVDYKKSLLRGIADVTAYIRKSNDAYGQPHAHRVYIEVPQNWQMVIDIANLLKMVDVPIQTIDFAHPNFRDSKLVKYNQGKPDFWKKEHQIKIWANEFMPIGFNVKHKEEALEKFSNDLLTSTTAETTHKFYWEKRIVRRFRPKHPGENDVFIPESVRGFHYESWTDLAKDLGYHA